MNSGGTVTENESVSDTKIGKFTAYQLEDTDWLIVECEDRQWFLHPDGKTSIGTQEEFNHGIEVTGTAKQFRNATEVARAIQTLKKYL